MSTPLTFLAPAGFALAVLLPILILLYLLRLRRTERQVSSTYLWQQVTRDLEANTPWQRLRRSLLLLLQLLFLIILILAVARPATPTQEATGQAVIIIMDTSASMAATDVLPNRFEAARQQARRLIEALPSTARVTIIAAGQRASILLANSLDRRQAFQALDELSLQAAGSDLTVALQLASAIARRQPDTLITILSDGGAGLPERLALPGQVRYQPIGQSAENQAVSLLTLEAAPGSRSLTALAQVSNYGTQPAERRLVFLADGLPFSAHDLSIPPQTEQVVLAQGILTSTQLVTAQLQPVDDPSAAADFLPLDDQASALVRTPTTTRVTLLSTGNVFLETALTLLPGVQLTRLDPASLSRPAAAATDVLVIDGSLPLTATLPAASLLWIGPLSSSAYFSVTGVITHPMPVAVNPADPLLANLSLAEVNILDAARLSLPAWAQPVIRDRAQGAPLLFAGVTGGRRLAVLAFDLRRSDLPLQIAFPILIANLLNWLAPQGGALIPAQLPPGGSLVFSPPPDWWEGADPRLIRAVIEKPDGSRLQLQPEVTAGQSLPQFVFAGTDQIGRYRLVLQNAAGQELRQEFVVNLFSPQESHIAPREVPAIGVSGTGAQTATQSWREWWRSLALLALAILTGEWLVYNRARTAWLWQRLTAGFKPKMVKRP